MKIQPISLILILLLWMSNSLHSAVAQSILEAPVPLSVRVKGRVATVPIDRRIVQVVLEQKNGVGWKPLAVSYPKANQRGPLNRTTFDLPAAIPASDLRAQGYRNLKFPSRFLHCKRAFDRLDTTVSGNNWLFQISGNLSYGNATTNLAIADDKVSAVSSSPAAVESDIWQIVGTQVFFFNQYRGLQILDLSDPTAPVRSGSLRLPASGEQMFILDEAGTQVALLGRSNDKNRQGAATIWLLRVTDGVPTLVSEVPLAGAITDSRLIGKRLHVLCNEWKPNANNLLNLTGEATLTSVDLTDIAKPEKLGSVQFPGYNSSLQAAEGHLLISAIQYFGGNLSEKRVHVVKIDEAPLLVKTITPRGAILDKFKMNIVNGAIVLVSIDSQDWSNRKTWIETFPLAGNSVDSLASFELIGARNENLHATRFDGDRLYVVTFRNIDPLFIIDLSNPAAPVLSGFLEVPGWSTYLEPLGDKLLAVGVEGSRVTISLFDVTDVTAPALLSRLPLGAEGQYSWSEANYDEKAVEYLPEQGILMVPFQMWQSGPFANQKAIQIVNVGNDTVTSGGVIEHNFNPRRGSWIAGHFVTISGQELLVQSASTNASASDGPEVALSLAWRTDRVVPVGDYLIQIEDGTSSWYANKLWAGMAGEGSNALVRITSAIDPDGLIEVIELGAGQIVGITENGSQLYLAQWVPATAETPQSLRTLALDLSGTPTIEEVARVEHDLSGLSRYDLNLNAVQPLWTDTQTLVWFIPLLQRQWWWHCGIGVITNGFPIAGPTNSTTGNLPSSLTDNVVRSSPPVISRDGPIAAVLCPISVTSQIVPQSPRSVAVTGNWKSTTAAFTDAGYIFFSYDTAVVQSIKTKSSSPLTKRNLRLRGTPTGNLVINLQPMENRLASWLQVVDWRADTPIFREPASIPGPLISVTQVNDQGALILTNTEQDIKTNTSKTRVIQASAYDGISAWQLDSYITATPFYTAYATEGSRIYLAREYEATTKGVVGIGYNQTSGRLAQITTWTTDEAPNRLNVINGHLLSSSYGNLEVAGIDAANGALKPVAAFDTPVDLWLPVDRATFTADLDLWIPAGDYGVEYLQSFYSKP